MTLALEIKNLRAACAVAQAGSTAAAARQLHLSQSAVARAVLALESGLGMALFDRAGRGMTPTEAAQTLLRRGLRALQRLAAVDAGPRRPGAETATAWWHSRLATGASHRHLQVLVSLAQTRSETRSAADLGISQPAVHQVLAQLEHMSAAPLFLRARTGLRLTEAGDGALQAAKLALSELRQADEELAAQRGAAGGRLVIGTLPFSTAQLLPAALDRALGAMPGLAVTIIDGTYDSLVHQLRHAEVDLIVGALRPLPPGDDIQQEALFLDPLAVVARADHPLARQRRPSWLALSRAQWVMPMPHTPAQAAFEQAFKAAGVPVPDNPLRVNSALMMQALLARSDRLAMMSARQLQREIRAGLLVQLPVAVHHEPRTIGVIRRADHLPAPGAQRLLDALRAVAEDLGHGLVE